MLAVELNNLTKEYRRFGRRTALAVNGLDLAVPAGSIFGFLGPNGSGKTTTIRCMLGLSQPSGGTCRLFGVDPARALSEVVDRVGALVEAPGFLRGLSARRNLLLFARIGGVRPHVVSDVLDRVGLGRRANELVGAYSTGMRQRLGIALALLKDPDILVLDEPANGLDPGGVKEVRELVQQLGEEGRTVFLSSHDLSEVQEVCTQVAILAHGRTVASGSVDEVLARGRAGGSGLLVRLADLQAGVGALKEAGIEAVRSGHFIRVRVPPSGAETVNRALVSRGLYASELRPEHDLERVFLELTDRPETGR